MRIKRLIVIVLCLIMLVLPFASGCGSEVQEDVDQSMTESQLESQTAIGGEETETMKNEDREYDLPISWESLKQTGKNKQRWLSLPFSRIVINPHNFNVAEGTTEAAYSDRPSMPLNLGFLSPYSTSGSGEWLEDLITLYEKGATVGGVETIFQANLESKSGWTTSGGSYTQLDVKDGVLKLTVQSGANVPWQYAAADIDVDLSDDPILTVTVDSCENGWALKVCEKGKVDEVLIKDTTKTGTFSLNLSEILNRKDRFVGQIKLFEIGYDCTVTMSRLSIDFVESECETAQYSSTAWTPSELEFNAVYPKGLKVEGTDLFADERTVLRHITVAQTGNLVLMARIAGTPTYDSSSHTLRVEHGNYSYVIRTDLTASPRFYSDYNHALADADGSPDCEATAQYMVWRLKGVKEGTELNVAICIETDAVSSQQLADHASDVLSKDYPTIRNERKRMWEDYLMLVPRPSSFDFKTVSSMNVKANDVKKYYYTAWIFLAQNILPENPELNYPYPQVCCGKPSMWAYGAPEAAYSASWESFFGIQLLGYVQPDTAWAALKGLISLVDEDGLLGGESLPSEKAHSAWLLYELTGDKEALAGLYDNIAHYLDWRIENPRWIYLDHNDVNSADADFVASALVDIEYMIKISEILEKTEKISEWEEKHDALLSNYYRWNFDGGNVYQYCNKITLARTPGCTIWTTKGLMVDGLDEAHIAALIKRFNTEYSSKKTLAGLAGVKYPEISQAILGLQKVGETEKAAVLAEVCARDVVRCGMFAENYTNADIPVGTGVRPAMFGCAMMIDSVLMMNGFSYATVSSITLQGAQGSVSNVQIRGETYSFEVK